MLTNRGPMMRDVWLYAGPPLLKFAGETLIVIGQVLEEAGILLQHKGIDLLEARQRLMERSKEREARKQRINSLRSAYVP